MEESPIIFIAGQEKCGKSSIVDTFFLDTTTSLKKYTSTRNPFLDYNIWELPSDLAELQKELKSISADLYRVAVLIYVFNLENSNLKSGSPAMKNIDGLIEILSRLTHSKDLHLSVFFHKSDISLTTEQQNDYQKLIQSRISERLSDIDIHLSTNFCRTSIYDNSVFDGISKCIQRVLPKKASIQVLLNALSQSCNMDKVYLFDTYSKLCIAMDSSPNESSVYELCSDSIDVVFELVNIYCGRSTTSFEGTLGELIEGGETNEDLTSPVISSIQLEKSKHKYMVHFYQSIQNIAFVCIIREENFDKMGLIEYNLHRVSDCLKELYSTSE